MMRTARGLTVERAAKLAGVSIWSWKRWESASASIPSERLADIDRALAPFGPARDEHLVDIITPYLVAA